MFTKKNLQNGDVVLKRNGSVEIVMSELDSFILPDGWNGLADINEDLTSEMDRKYDIIEVRRPLSGADCRFDAFEEKRGRVVYNRNKAVISVGSIVRVVSTGYNYSTYTSWFRKNAPTLLNQFAGKCSDDDRAIVVAKAPHEDARPMLYACVKENGEIFLIGEDGIEKEN